MLAFMAGTLAVCASLEVHFFVDDASPAELYPSDNRFATFIAVRNTTDRELSLVIEYWDKNGTSATPAENVYVLAPQGSMSWRPAACSPGIEQSDVPDMVGVTSGSARIRFVGKNGELVGRVMTLTRNGHSAYLLPTGPED